MSGDVFSRVDEAVEKAYIDAKLRLSVVKDAINDRANTGTNAPAFCEIEAVDEPGVARLNLMIKGGGSDNASCVQMLVPGDGKDGIIKSVVDRVKEKAAAACPPLIIGIGIGGTFDSVAGLAQRALYRPVGKHHESAKTARLEQEILEAVNRTDIGAGGLGGIATAAQVNIETAPCHIASMPLAIDMGCSALRRVSIDVPFKNHEDCCKDKNCKVTHENIKDAIDSAFAMEKDTQNKASDAVSKNIKNFGAKYSECKKGQSVKLSEPIKLQLPLKREDLKNLKAGDKVLLTGPIYTLRDAGHIRLLEEMKNILQSK